LPPADFHQPGPCDVSLTLISPRTDAVE
jgi:hypothetical protein